MAQVKTYTDKPCGKCYGDGWYQVAMRRISCGSCNGTGIVTAKRQAENAVRRAARKAERESWNS